MPSIIFSWIISSYEINLDNIVNPAIVFPHTVEIVRYDSKQVFFMSYITMCQSRERLNLYVENHHN
jgi:hypothetical protein